MVPRYQLAAPRHPAIPCIEHAANATQARFADLRTEAAPASEQQAEIDAQRGALEADVAVLKQEYARLQKERSQLQGDVQASPNFMRCVPHCWGYHYELHKRPLHGHWSWSP